MKTIRVAGPGKNALSTAVMQRLLDDLSKAEGEPVLFTGEGDVFSAGLNLKEIATLDEPGMRTFLGTLEELVRVLYERAAPTVAWVNGHAIAGGCVLVLACDLRVMTSREGARIGLNETPLGLRFPPRTFELVRRRLPVHTIEEVLLGGALFDAARARELGLVDMVGDEALARSTVERLATSPRDVFAYNKRALRAPLTVPKEDEERFLREVVPHWSSDELRGRLMAVLGKK